MSLGCRVAWRLRRVLCSACGVVGIEQLLVTLQRLSLARHVRLDCWEHLLYASAVRLGFIQQRKLPVLMALRNWNLSRLGLLGFRRYRNADLEHSIVETCLHLVDFCLER